jgi:hypothetical protein
MKNIFIYIFIFLYSSSSIAQKPLNQLEITPYLRFDKYPQFEYAINAVNSNKVKLKGTSWGVHSAYKLFISNKYYLKIGIGYFKYSFNDIDQINSLFGRSKSRVISYKPQGPWVPAIIYTTDKYWYHTITAAVGIERQMTLANDLHLVIGFDSRQYYSFSQNYHIHYPVPQGINYNPKTSRYFGFNVALNAGLQKKFGRISIGPQITLPIYDVWKKDNLFPQEKNGKSRKKWIRGFGVGIGCNYLLNRSRLK